ncbi:MAG: glycosyltransferase family 4 protein [Thermoguttaceae bacterium]|jgi:glycosyltransferase involved in cell wall biosynthesis|nr:glycosyltransferase family 4 protein [Thermoguttaceae bacterium]
MTLAGKRILILLESLELGGAERQAIHLARYLSEREGTTVEVRGLGAPGAASDLCDAWGIPWRSVRLDWYGTRFRRLAGIAAMARQLACQHPDAIVPYCRVPNIVAGLIWRWTGARACLWNQRDAGLDLGRSRLERWAVRHAPAVVANAPYAAERLGRLFDLRQPIHVVPNGVRLDPPAADRAAWRARLGIDPHAFVACMVANIHRSKDHATLLRAWRRVVDRLAARRQNPLLVLAGRLDEPLPVKALAFDLDLGRYVRFLGPVEDISGLLGAADLGVFSSPREGCPNGVLECMAAGLAVVATDAPGVRDVLGPAAAPCLAAPHDDTDLAERILDLLLDRARRAELGAANRRRVESQYTWEAMGRRMTEILADQFSPRKPSAPPPHVALPHRPDSCREPASSSPATTRAAT